MIEPKDDDVIKLEDSLYLFSQAKKMAIAEGKELDGVECQLLPASGGGWQKGTIRFRIEFIPDEQISGTNEL